MISKKTKFLIVLVISVFFAVSLSGCFDDGEADNASSSMNTSIESPVTSESFHGESLSSSEGESDNDSDNDDSANASEERISESQRNDDLFTVNSIRTADRRLTPQPLNRVKKYPNRSHP